MKRLLLALLIPAMIFAGTERKKVENTFDVKESHEIIIKAVNGCDLRVVGWEELKVKFDLDVTVTSSDKNYEKEYIENFKIREDIGNIRAVFEMEKFERSAIWGIKDLLTLNFGTSIETEIKGVIYVPMKNYFELELKYGEVELSEISGEIVLESRSSKIELVNCPNIRGIENDYGELKIKKSGGNSKFEIRSGIVDISSFSGKLDLTSEYGEIGISEISEDLKIESRSADIKINGVGGNLEIVAPYSNLNISDVKGTVQVEDRSSEIKITDVGSIKLDAPYSNVFVRNVSGINSLTNEFKLQSGSLDIANAKGNLVVNDTYSNFTLNQIVGDVKLDSRSGFIKADNVKGNWSSELAYMNVDIKNLDGEQVSIVNRGNPISVEMLKVPVQIYIESDYGSVDLSIPNGFEGNVLLESTHGNINCELPIGMRSEGSKVTGFKEVLGSNNQIKVRAKSDDINIKVK